MGRAPVSAYRPSSAAVRGLVSISLPHRQQTFRTDPSDDQQNDAPDHEDARRDGDVGVLGNHVPRLPSDITSVSRPRANRSRPNRRFASYQTSAFAIVAGTRSPYSESGPTRSRISGNATAITPQPFRQGERTRFSRVNGMRCRHQGPLSWPVKSRHAEGAASTWRRRARAAA
jgi:hypothetical protein